eukprot:SAG31_NODE_146_length_22601_cov_56.529192_11_plen_172_part_00
MNFVAAALLMAYGLEESPAFWLLAALCEQVLPPKFFASSLEGSKLELRLLSTLLPQQIPLVATKLQELEVPLELVASQWLLGLFSTSLPACTLFRLYDLLVVLGQDTLVVAALAMLELLQPELLIAADFGEVSATLKATQRLFDADLFVSFIVPLDLVVCRVLMSLTLRCT